MKDLQERSDKSTSVDEVRSIGETLTKLRDEIDEAEKNLLKSTTMVILEKAKKVKDI